MFQFIKYLEGSTPQGPIESHPLNRLSPAIYFGSRDGYFLDNYDPYNEKTLKHFKVSVAAATGGYDPILRLDTLDLYRDFNHTISGNITESDLRINAGQIASACPVKFQRIHFNAANKNGEVKEYQSIFLAGYPVPVDENSTDYSEGEKLTWVSGFANSTGDYANRLIIGGGGGTIDGDYAFKCTARLNLPASGDNPNIYSVRVLGGSAQAVGGEEHIFNDANFTGVEAEYIYVKYNLWNELGQTVCAWQDTIQHSINPPVNEVTIPKSLVFIIAKIGEDYSNYVNQFRVGSIQTFATINASPDWNSLTGLPLI